MFNIQFSNVSVDIVINSIILKNHQNFPLLSGFVKNIPDDVIAQDLILLVSESQIEQNLLDFIELDETLMRFIELNRIILSPLFICSDIS